MSNLFNRFKNRLNATRFEFTVSVHMLQPWPAGSKAIAIGWQRGKKRRGATSAIYPHANPGKLDCSLKFNEKFTVPATLYKASTTVFMLAWSAYQDELSTTAQLP